MLEGVVMEFPPCIQFAFREDQRVGFCIMCVFCCVQSLTAPEPDDSLVVEDYERSFEQNEELGLNDMKTENYDCLLYTSPSPRDMTISRMPSSA